MKQVLQSARNGTVYVADVPAPQAHPNGVLVRTRASLISAGTERASVEFGQKSLLGKARSRPDLVRQVLDKVRRDGFLEAARVARARLDRPVPLGYACAGTVIAVGTEATELRVGDRVACAGAGYAGHAEVNYVPRNLVVPIPATADGAALDWDEACFATLGAVAMHAVRLSGAAVGESAVVIGLGLVGLLTGQVLAAAGCRVLGVDVLAERCALARQLGFAEAMSTQEARERIAGATRGLGGDVVLITAASDDSAPAQLAAEVARERAKVVAVGTTGLDLPRRLYYRKELSLMVARSYGPGRYDPAFEEDGRDYPVGYVRWTERENLRAFLQLVADRRVDVRRLVTEHVPIAEAERAYAALEQGSTLGIVLTYADDGVAADTVETGGRPPSAGVTVGPGGGAAAGRIGLRALARGAAPGAVGVSVIGAGSFAQDVLLPVLAKRPDVDLRGIVTASGLSARSAGDRFGFRYCASARSEVWRDEATRAVIVATRNDLHATLVEEALAAGKAVFVEKPLCVTEDELGRLVRAHRAAAGGEPLVTVGFNRRFAPSIVALRALFRGIAPLTLQYRVNAGRLGEASWLAAEEQGGRLVGEACHFIDLCAFVAGAPVVSVFAQASRGPDDDFVATLALADGSVATLGFHAGGDRSFSKERLEVFGGGRVGVIDDFRAAWTVVRGARRRLGGRWSGPDKGHRAELAAFLDAVRTGGPSPVPFAEAVATTLATFALRESLRRGVPMSIDG